MTYSDAEIEGLADRLDREAICYLPPYGNFTPEELHYSRAAAMLRQLLSEVRAFRAESASHICEHLSTKKAGDLWWLCEDCGQYIERHFTRSPQDGDA